MMERIYVETVQLLLEIAPHVFRAGGFAMKGGTALNLFVREMPRLSVDIDLVYLDHSKERGDALAEISRALTATAQELNRLGLETRVTGTKNADESKLLIRRGDIVVKVEVNHVFRGTLLPVDHVGLSSGARVQFTLSSPLPILAAAELYGSKLVAALDRQHPRDLFDVAVLNQHGGLTTAVVDCFVGYLAGHNRPIHEVLFSREKDITEAFEGEF
jgi:predicted nucleotidyltransferase component of viral defense system